MLGLLKEIFNKYSLKIYAFCLMPNHLHLLFRPNKHNLSNAMRDLFSRYAMRFNRKYERNGHLFAGPYIQAVCSDETYILAASLFIHLTPVHAGLAKTPQNYPWSSCRLYYDKDPSGSFLDPDFILDLLPIEQLLARGHKRSRIAERLGLARKTVYNLLGGAGNPKPFL